MRHFLLFVPFYRNSLYVVIVIDTASAGVTISLSNCELALSFDYSQ
jgi:hypothetical protein